VHANGNGSWIAGVKWGWWFECVFDHMSQGSEFGQLSESNGGVQFVWDTIWESVGCEVWWWWPVTECSIEW